MKTGKNNNYIKTFEEFKKDPTAKIQEIFLKLKTDVENWFSKGAFSQEKEVTLTECVVNTDTTQPTITFEFSSPQNYFEVILKGDMENLSKDDTEKIFLLEIKRFDSEKADLIDRKEIELSEGEFTEDYLLKLIATSETEESEPLTTPEETIDELGEEPIETQ